MRILPIAHDWPGCDISSRPCHSASETNGFSLGQVILYGTGLVRQCRLSLRESASRLSVFAKFLREWQARSFAERKATVALPARWLYLSPRPPLRNGEGEKFHELLLTFARFKLFLYSGDDARGGFCHVRGTDWGVLGHYKKMFSAAQKLWHESSSRRGLKIAQLACRKSGAQQFATQIKGCFQGAFGRCPRRQKIVFPRQAWRPTYECEGQRRLAAEALAGRVPAE